MDIWDDFLFFPELDEKLQEMKRVQRQNEELKIHAERAKKLAEDLKVGTNSNKQPTHTSKH